MISSETQRVRLTCYITLRLNCTLRGKSTTHNKTSSGTFFSTHILRQRHGARPEEATEYYRNWSSTQLVCQGLNHNRERKRVSIENLYVDIWALKYETILFLISNIVRLMFCIWLLINLVIRIFVLENYDGVKLQVIHLISPLMQRHSQIFFRIACLYTDQYPCPLSLEHYGV